MCFSKKTVLAAVVLILAPQLARGAERPANLVDGCEGPSDRRAGESARITIAPSCLTVDDGSPLPTVVDDPSEGMGVIPESISGEELWVPMFFPFRCLGLHALSGVALFFGWL